MMEVRVLPNGNYASAAERRRISYIFLGEFDSRRWLQYDEAGVAQWKSA